MITKPHVRFKDVVDGDPHPQAHGSMDDKFAKGTWNAQFIDEIQPRIASGEQVLHGHGDFCAFHGTQLFSLIKRNKVKTLIVCGFLTDSFVEETARACSVILPGLKIIVCFDGCAAKTKEKYDNAIRATLPAHGCTVISCSGAQLVIRKEQQSSDTSVVTSDDAVQDADQQTKNLSKELELVDNDENSSAEEGKQETVLNRMSTIMSDNTAEEWDLEDNDENSSAEEGKQERVLNRRNRVTIISDHTSRAAEFCSIKPWRANVKAEHRTQRGRGLVAKFQTIDKSLWFSYSAWTILALLIQLILGAGDFAFPDGTGDHNNDGSAACSVSDTPINGSVCDLEGSLKEGQGNLKFLNAFIVGGFLLSSVKLWLTRRTAYCALCGATRNLLINLCTAVDSKKEKAIFVRWAVLGYELAVLKGRGLIDLEEGKKYLQDLRLIKGNEWEKMVDGDRHTTGA